MDLAQQLEQADADRVDGITTDKQYMERRAEIVARALDYDDLIMQAKERALLRGM
ncbi:hypothetical protein LMG26685_02923 [Achromobacter mucicolens]|uniref:hypothetical protein n=1 Tax=Achromobacter mucicolens TaxID=1389922 RepID=UPI0013031BDA|nr:hypothetical protein [Achromobacter mucicolens]CAB3654420.1 hypothetical protein LMG26685_02923 [Achromobacter mucicolens]